MFEETFVSLTIVLTCAFRTGHGRVDIPELTNFELTLTT